ncbi:MAG: D-hexose-6-phosphate mutarotase, partial [Limisphaerales bacterium]
MKSNPAQEIPGRVIFMEGNGDLPKIEITTPWSHAEIYLQGAHITHFQNIGEPPLLFLSQVSRFESGMPIRGGIPIIFPWFGPREGQVMHGFARTKTWELKEIIQAPSGGIYLKFCLPDCAEASLLPKFSAEYVVEINKNLAAELIIKNMSPDQNLNFENCLHTYFTVGDVNAISIHGLKGIDYLNKVENFARKTETNDAIKIFEETDRVYLDTTS